MLPVPPTPLRRRAPIPARPLRRAALAAALAGCLCLAARAEPTAPDRSRDAQTPQVQPRVQPQVQWSPTETLPLVEWRRSLFRGRDAGPRMALFADGRLRVHVPAFMKGAGDFEARLSPQELRTILEKMLSVSTAESSAEQAPASPRLVGASAAETSIELRLDAYASPLETTPPRSLHVQWELRGAEPRSASTATDLELARRADQVLSDLRTHPALRPVEVEP